MGASESRLLIVDVHDLDHDPRSRGELCWSCFTRCWRSYTSRSVHFYNSSKLTLTAILPAKALAQAVQNVKVNKVRLRQFRGHKLYSSDISHSLRPKSSAGAAPCSLLHAKMRVQASRGPNFPQLLTTSPRESRKRREHHLT